MFQSLSDRLQRVIKNVRGHGRLSDDNIQDALRDIRVALLEADVALPVVKCILDDVKTRAMGEEVATSLNPGQAFTKIVNEELIRLMGDECTELDLTATPPAVILMAGLQGSGKTTSTAKLARFLKEQKKKVLVVSTDIYRPAAIDQLKTVAEQVEVDWFPSSADQKPVAIANAAITHAKKQFHDVVIVDTAGRLHIDEAMMQEIKALHAAVTPVETLFVVDSMTGQDAANTAKAFHDALPLTGIVLTKVDGDARGGAALSIRHITGKPIKFLGVGEKLSALESFHPERLASRILGMGDMMGLIEEIEAKVDEKKAKKAAKKLKKGGFDLTDYREQLQQMNNMGGMSGLLSKLPGAGDLSQMMKDKVNDKMFDQTIAIINSMTPKERRKPDLIKGSRKRRIANGSGKELSDVNRLLKQFNQMQKMMKKAGKKGGMQGLMQSMQGRMPPGMMG
ncbi:MAG: signal recognition particle protein [marine bacterium B5-7]|nr:MAG: signal recognition particle protein [marine bacterium B5-7]